MKYSIIIPHYNSQESLIRCLSSIPDHELFQIIVVDDCSDRRNTDFSVVRRMSRRSFDLEILPFNQGAGVARNVGIQKAKGEWLIFADSDDYFMPDMFSLLQNATADTKEDVIIFNIDEKDNDSVQGKRYRKLIDEYNYTDKSLDDVRYRSWTPWAKLFRKSFVDSHHLYFESRKKGNDCYFVLNAMQKAQNIRVYKDALYHLTYSLGSLSHRKTDDWDYMFDVYDLWLWRYNFYRNNNIYIWKEYNIFYLLIEIFRRFGINRVVQIFIRGFNYHYDYISLVISQFRK